MNIHWELVLRLLANRIQNKGTWELSFLQQLFITQGKGNFA